MEAELIKVNDGRYLNGLMVVEQLAWAAPGENVTASGAKISARISSGQFVTIALVNQKPAGSQFAFRFNWDGKEDMLGSWDQHTSNGWTDRLHDPIGDTGFLVGVGVVPEFRGMKFRHNLVWPGAFKLSELLIAFTLQNLFCESDSVPAVCQVIANARVPFYHKHPELDIEEYCQLRREDGKLFDPVLRFHERMGAALIKPCAYSMEDTESLNAGCWVKYTRPFSPD